MRSSAQESPEFRPHARRTVWADRVIGRYEGDERGPALISIAGVHGNEPAGIPACRRVLARLEELRPRMRGRYEALAGNLAALERGERYIERDLNRIWTEAELQEMRASDPADDSFERREVRGLLGAVESAARGDFERLVLLDLHSTSGEGPPWAVIGDTLQNREIAFTYGIPVILGLEENVEGTLLGYAGERGHVSIGFEGGSHDDPLTERHHEAAIWMTLVAAGLLRAEDVPGYEMHRQLLAAAGRNLPAVVEVVHRHGIEPDEEFRMEPGFENFAPVHKGELLAWTAADADSEELAVPAPEDGLLLLPRYQGQGTDGFFVGHSVRPFWLTISEHVRRWHLERALAWLPGVEALRGDGRILEVDRRIARFLATDIFHLLGYRKCRKVGNYLIFSRRIEGARETLEGRS